MTLIQSFFFLSLLSTSTSISIHLNPERGTEVMQRRRVRQRRNGQLRCVLTFAVSAMAVVTVFSFVAFQSSTVHTVHSDLYAHQAKLETAVSNGSGELRWTQEHVPSILSKLGGENEKVEFLKLWKKPSGRDFVPCVDPNKSYLPPGESRGYLIVHTNGGLNQMRAGISDMVAIARMINATLVIPKLDKGSFWQDTSKFSDVFDQGHFIHSLSNDIKIVKKLPNELKGTTKAVKQFRSWSGVEYYQDVISSLWNDYKIVKTVKSDSRLTNNNLPLEIQRLRCRAFYNALRFAPRIEALGKLMVERMRSYGPYIALHLRYEKDMLAFSGCTYGLSPCEANELTRLRDNTTHWKVKDIDPDEQRVKGRCPLTPKEIGLFLSALGYPSTTPVYIAAGEIYGGHTHMVDLEALFPILMNKAKLASSEELGPFTHYASQMAALDYIVSVESDVFVPSYSGNMARAVEGHRRFLGHRKTISPDRKQLVHLFDKLESGNLQGGEKLSSQVIEIHKKRQGSPRKRRGPIPGTKGKKRFRSEEAFYENPLPDCLCRKGSTARVTFL